MGQITSKELTEFFAAEPVEAFRLDGIKETEDSRYLGAIGLSLTQPLFHSIHGFNFSGVLSDSARFYAVPVRAAVEGRDGVVALFRQFDSSKYQASPEDLVAGWVAPEREPQLRAWIDDMNQQLQALLALKARA